MELVCNRGWDALEDVASHTIGVPAATSAIGPISGTCCSRTRIPRLVFGRTSMWPASASRARWPVTEGCFGQTQVVRQLCPARRQAVPPRVRLDRVEYFALATRQVTHGVPLLLELRSLGCLHRSMEEVYTLQGNAISSHPWSEQKVEVCNKLMYSRRADSSYK